MAKCKYYRLKKQVSYDNGLNWQDVIPYEYIQGAEYEYHSTDCGYVGNLERWINSGTTCEGYDKYNLQVKQTSTDGINWVTTEETQLGSLIELNSEDCGYVAHKKLQLTYNDSTEYDINCNESSELTNSEVSGGTNPISAITSAEIGDCVTSIGDEAFSSCSSLASIDIPSGVTTIGLRSFSGCSSLTSVTIPNSVTSIGKGAFWGCSGLTTITIPNSVTSISNSAFNSCSSLASVNIPNSITSIGNYAFWGCNSLTSIDIPSGVTTIGMHSFRNCTRLTSIDIPSGVTIIGKNAFDGCSSLTSVTVNASTPPTLGTDAFYNTNNCPIYVPCESVNTYKNAANWSDYASRIEAIPNSCHSVKFKAWYSDSTTYSAECDASSALTTADTRAHTTAYSAMTSAIIGDCVTSIGESAFDDCRSLTSINIPSGVTSIGYYAFRNCRSLTSCTIGSGVTTIGNGAFRNCSGLTSVNIPNSVTSIGISAFNGCGSLTSIDIPSGVTSIGGYVFRDCNSLTSVTVNATEPPTLGTNVFYNTSCPIYVPAASVETYKAASGWSDYASRIQAIP